ncbi:GPW/gp25 family protein [Lachnospiraceae bacterium C1.1]|nr:GPW/gp25 family protein [Lachnospiraceae bacterium C1.1]
MQNAKNFLGSGWKFPIQLDPRTGKIAVSTLEENIEESIGIILSTYRGERVMRADFGTNIPDYVFSPVNYTEKESIAYELNQQLLIDEPRIRDIEVECRDGSIDGGLEVSVSYTVRTTNNRYNKVYPFYKEGQDDR